MSKIVINENSEILYISEEGTYAHIVGIGEEMHWEACSEEIARNDHENCTCDETKIIDGGIYFPSINMIMPFGCGASQLIDVEVPEGILAREYKYENGEFIINTPVRIARIKKELEELDVIINRATEDLYVATGTSAYANVQDVINRKNELRAELAQLEA